jgi:hypothetical protein
MSDLIKKFLSSTALMVAAAAATTAAVPAYAASFECTTPAMRKNKWICKEDPQLCSFIFAGSQRDKTLLRKGRDGEPNIKIVVDKWDDKYIIAHEDRPRIDNLFIEQFFYRIELDSGNFFLANDYVTNSGRYLSRDDIAATDKKRFSYNPPKFFTEPGTCKMKTP